MDQYTSYSEITAPNRVSKISDALQGYDAQWNEKFPKASEKTKRHFAQFSFQ